MNPNPLDVQTIHASQNDGEARQWEFELHNNGELIDTSDVTEQMFFKSYKGGTEQLLPENTSTPTTSPFIGDIRYPQGLLSDQEFTYRQSPTEEDGLAWIKSIKGQTLKWNQLLNVGTLTAQQGVDQGLTLSNNFNFVANHKYLLSWNQTVTMTSNTRNIPAYYDGTNHYGVGGVNNNLEKGIYTWIFTPTNTTSQGRIWLWVHTPNIDVPYTDIMLFDLTLLGIDSLTNAEILQWFADYFPLSYYSYNSGSLIPFMGNGIKTVGKNQVANVVRGYFSVGSGAINVDNDSESLVFYAIKGKTYVSSSAVTLNRNDIARCDTPNLVHGSPIYDIVKTSRTWTATWTGWTVWYVYSSRNETVENSAQVEFGTTATAYEPYTESVLNLPISTYFPSGMKDVPDYTNGGKIFDEMTSNKADTRVGSVDLGTLDWTTYSSPERHIFRATILPNMKQPNREILPNAMCSRYEPMAYDPISADPISANDDGYFAIGGQRIVIIEHDYTDPAAFKESLSNIYLYYELATPTETSFTTASLVTENAEIPLSNEDGTLIGKCTEQLSAEPGFHDAKIKLSDSDGTCYSNKIQLHVERSPQ